MDTWYWREAPNLSVQTCPRPPCRPLSQAIQHQRTVQITQLRYFFCEILGRIFAYEQVIDPIIRPAEYAQWTPTLPAGTIDANELTKLKRDKEDFRKWNPVNCRMAWISVLTHVCRRWRAVAMADHRLWSRPTIYLGLAWFEEMLRRSQHAPLIIDGEDCGLSHWHTPTRRHLTDVMLNVVTSHSQRIRVVKIKSDNLLAIDLLFSPYGALEEIEYCCPERFDLRYPQGGSLEGPLDLFNGHAPRLRSLSISQKGLSYDQFPWHMPMWDHIEHIRLTLGGTLLQHGSKSPILSALGRARALKTLYLDLPWTKDHLVREEPSLSRSYCTDKAFEPITLSRTLARVELRGCLPMIAHFLMHLRLFNTTDIQIHSLSKPDSEAAYLPCLRKATNFDRFHAPSARAVALIETTSQTNGMSRIELRLSDVETALMTFHAQLPSIVGRRKSTRDYKDIRFCLALSRQSISSLVPCVSDARVLTIAAGSSVKIDIVTVVYMKILRQSISLRHLTLSGVKLTSIISFLEMREDKGDTASKVLLPSLRSISIGACVVWDFISTVPGSTDTVAMRLRRALQSRAACDCPVHLITVHIKEELELIQAEDWDRTSCSKYLQNVGELVGGRLEELYAIEGLSIVPYESVYVLNDDGQTGRLVDRPL